jgi:hypothetical protein
MTNSQADLALRLGNNYGKLYGRLDSARTLMQQAIDESGEFLTISQHDELVRVRDRINGVIGMVLDASRREAFATISRTTTLPKPKVPRTFTVGQIVQVSTDFGTGKYSGSAKITNLQPLTIEFAWKSKRKSLVIGLSEILPPTPAPPEET